MEVPVQNSKMQTIRRQEMILIVIAVFVIAALFAAFFVEDVDKTLSFVLAMAAAFYFLIAIALSFRLMKLKKKIEGEAQVESEAGCTP